MEFFYRHVAAKYVMVPGTDRIVNIAGMYSGSLSKITMRVADKMFADGDNQLIKKEEPETPEALNTEEEIS